MQCPEEFKLIKNKSITKIINNFVLFSVFMMSLNGITFDQEHKIV